MWQMLIKSFLSSLILFADTTQLISQTIPSIYEPVGKMKFTHIIFKTKFLKTKIIASSFMCVLT